MPPALEIKDGKATVNFRSLPSELRDEIYDFALISHEPIASPIHIDRYEKGTRDFNLHPSYALLSIKASTLKIALEARETFFRGNTFVVFASALSDFLGGDTGHVNGPGRFSITPWISKLQIALDRWEFDRVKVEKPARMISQFQLLQNCPSLRAVTIGIFGGGELLKYQLLHTLQSVSFSCEDLHSRLGRGLKVEVEMRYHQCEDDAECTHHQLEWSGRYDGFKQMHENMTDDCTRRMLLSAADWAEATVGNCSGGNGTQNGDADIGN